MVLLCLRIGLYEVRSMVVDGAFQSNARSTKGFRQGMVIG